MSWEQFIYFAMAAILLWAIGALLFKLRLWVRRDKESKEVITDCDHLFSLYHLELLLKQMRDELMEATTPGEELVTCTLGYRRVDLDTQLVQAIHDGLTLDEVLATPVHIEVMNLLVELVGIGKDTIVGGLDI